MRNVDAYSAIDGVHIEPSSAILAYASDIAVIVGAVAHRFASAIARYIAQQRLVRHRELISLGDTPAGTTHGIGHVCHWRQIQPMSVIGYTSCVAAHGQQSPSHQRGNCQKHRLCSGQIT